MTVDLWNLSCLDVNLFVVSLIAWLHALECFWEACTEVYI